MGCTTSINDVNAKPENLPTIPEESDSKNQSKDENTKRNAKLSSRVSMSKYKKHERHKLDTDNESIDSENKIISEVVNAKQDKEPEPTYPNADEDNDMTNLNVQPSFLNQKHHRLSGMINSWLSGRDNAPSIQVTIETVEEKKHELDSEELCAQIHGMIYADMPLTELKDTMCKDISRTLEICDQLGLTPLHLAAKLGRFDILKMLLSLKANMDAQTLDGNTPLHYAIGYNRFDCAVKLKHAGCNELICNNLGFKASTGFDGDGSFGIAALFSASGLKQVDIAFKICEQYPNDINLLRFLDGVAALKATLRDKGWGEEQDLRVTLILAKLKAKETTNLRQKEVSFVSTPQPSPICHIFCF